MPHFSRLSKLLLLLLTSVSLAQQPAPVVEFASLLNSLDVYPTDGRLMLLGDGEKLTTVFLPQGAPVEAVLTKQGSTTPLFVQDFYVTPVTKLFFVIDTRGRAKTFKFREPGNYVLTYRSAGKVMTQVPFRAVLTKSDDEFDPKVGWYLQGPWQDWAYVFSLLEGKGDATLEFRMWGQRMSFDGPTKTDKYDVELRKNGDLIAVSRTGHVGTQQNQKLEFKMRHPDSKGGENYQVKELTKANGSYHFVVRRNKELHAVFELVMKDGRPVLHPRQVSTYDPRSEYIVPRHAALHVSRGRHAGNTVWMKRLDAAKAKAVAEGKPAPASQVTDEQKKRWQWLPKSVDPNRPFKVTVTDVETRTDTGIAAGEDIIVFGTGFPTGVMYLKVGDKEARDIPDGELYSSKLFHVCGSKIVLVHKNQVAIFDTKTQRTTKIPAKDITLYNPVGGLHQGNLLNANGFLVVAVNKATAVADRTILKVIDLSADQPRIIPIKNANYVDSDVSSVTVDAKNGYLAISSRQKKFVGVAKVAPGANQRLFDMTEFRGVGRQQIYLEGTSLTYADEDGKVRLLQAGSSSPKAITDQPLGSSSNGFFVRKGRLVIATQEKYGTRYHMALSDLDEMPRVLEGTATPIPGTSGGLGMAGCAAIAYDKTVFLAGTPSGGIGVGEHLQVLDKANNRWVPIKNEQGKVITAIDATTSMGLLAFKSADKNRKTTIGYATYGQRIELPSSGSVAASNSPTPGAAGKVEMANDNPYNTQDEQLAAKLEAYLDSEKQVLEAYVQAFGEEQGKKRTVEGIIKSMKAAGNAGLIDDYRRISKLIPAKDKPKTTEGTSQAQDPRAVMAALNGEWKSIRFSAQGKDLPDAAIENLSLTFANGKYVMSMGSELQTGTYTISTGQNPMAMTIHIASGDKKGQQRKGSFKLLKGNRLLMTFATNETGHPTRFIPDASGQAILAVYEKKKK